MNMPVVDESKVVAFAGKLVSMLNSGGLALMTSIGHRTGLFDAMAGRAPATSVEIAEGAELDERYVREWLGAMVTGEVVLYSPETDSYELPAEHAACLTRSAAPNNMAAKAQFIGVLASVEDQVVRCFRNGGGVPYSAYSRFQEVMAEDSEQTIPPPATSIQARLLNSAPPGTIHPTSRRSSPSIEPRSVRNPSVPTWEFLREYPIPRKSPSAL
jgi:hypothetical protein